MRITATAEHLGPNARAGPSTVPDGNRRRQRRVSMNDLDALLGRHHNQQAVCFRVQILDLSSGGAQLQSRHDLSIGSRIQLFIRVGTQTPLVLPGDVAWVRQDDTGWRAGIRFADVDEQTTQAVSRLVFTARWRSPI